MPFGVVFGLQRLTLLEPQGLFGTSKIVSDATVRTVGTEPLTDHAARTKELEFHSPSFWYTFSNFGMPKQPAKIREEIGGMLSDSQAVRLC